MPGMLDKLLAEAKGKSLSLELVSILATFKVAGKEYDIPFTAGTSMEKFSKDLWGKIESASKPVQAPRGPRRKTRLTTAPVVDDAEEKVRAKGWPEESIQEFKGNESAMRTMSQESFRGNSRFTGLGDEDLTEAIRNYLS